MGRRVLRHPLGGGFEPVRAAAALMAGRDDAVWLDSGDTGLSVLASGTVVDPGSPAFPGIAAALADLGPIERAEPPGAAPAFVPGLVGWLGYELRGETTATPVPHPSETPSARFLAVDRAVLVDGRTGSAELVALGEDWTGEVAEWRDRVTSAMADTVRAPFPVPAVPRPTTGRWRSSAERYREMIAACQAAIREGQAYQLCLTTEIEVDASPDPFDLYLRLRSTSPSHHGALLRIGGVSLVSASPERFLGIAPDGMVETSPIKGTRRRGRDPVSDAALAAELVASEKERAENVMIVDLMRNDLSRVCAPETIEVSELLVVESYAQVHQLVSTVRGRLADGVRPLDAVAACFPAGSMTGAPKRRATQILDALEDRPRGLYAGAFGYFGVDGSVDLAMTIRSIVLDRGRATIGTGGGITALSDPEAEVEETAIKAAPLLAALGARAPLR